MVSDKYKKISVVDSDLVGSENVWPDRIRIQFRRFRRNRFVKFHFLSGQIYIPVQPFKKKSEKLAHKVLLRPCYVHFSIFYLAQLLNRIWSRIRNDSEGGLRICVRIRK
jgi:hypothetical protein